MVTVGEVRGPYGIQGWVRLASFTAPPEGLLGYKDWQLRPRHSAAARDAWCAVRIEAVKPHGQGFIASFGGVRDRDAAAALAGAQIGVPASSLPSLESDEFYWRDLMGLTVVNEDGQPLGVVERLIATGPHDVLVIKGREEVLIPFVEAYVTAVLPSEGRICVRWEGMD